MADTKRKRSSVLEVTGTKKFRTIAPPAIKASFPASSDGSEYVEDGASDGTNTVMNDSTSRDGSSQNSTPHTASSIGESFVTPVSGRHRPKGYLCDYEGCFKAFDRPVRLTEHQRSHTNERPFTCPHTETCQKSFLKNDHLKAHIRSKHNDERPYVCDFIITAGDVEQQCGKGFATGTRLRRHRALHEEKKGVECTEVGCERVFRKQEALQKHIRVEHLSEKPYQCAHIIIEGPGGTERECGAAFMSSTQLKGHEGREHGGLRYFCNLCNGGPIDMQELDAEGMEVIKIASRDLVGFQTYTDFQNHNKLAHPPSCDQCGKTCESQRALTAHIEIAHVAISDRIKVHCPYEYCARGFTKQGNLNVHIKTVHAKIKAFICGQRDLSNSKKVVGWDGQGCQEAFSTKLNLENHVLVKHLGHTPLTFRRKSKAIKSEEEENPTPTNEPMQDSGAGAFALAMLTGVGYEQHRPFGCLHQGCQKRLIKQYDLESHMELTHGWQIDDIADTLAEQEALEGGQFWIGGAGETRATAGDPQVEQDLHAVFSSAQGVDGRGFQALHAQPVAEPALDPMLMDID